MKKVLYVVENEESFQLRYRAKNLAESLDKSKEWKALIIAKDRIDNLELNEFDLVVIVRQTAKDGVINDFIKKLHVAKIKVLFDLDDLVFDYRDVRVLMKSVREKNVLYWLGYVWGIRRIAKKVDGFTCTNEFLAEKLKRSFGKPVKVIRNSLNREQVEVSEKCLKDKKHDGFVVGYFSGSATHKKDFELVESDLVRFLEEYEDVKMKVVGYMNFSKTMQGLIREGRVDVMKPVECLKLQRLVSQVDVNTAPLVVNDFTNCKSELKFFEAAAVETTTIASPTYAFKKAIKDGENGFLAKPGEWYDKLEYLYNHSKENQIIAKRARDYALEHYYGKEFLKEVESAYDYFAK